MMIEFLINLSKLAGAGPRPLTVTVALTHSHVITLNPSPANLVFPDL